jgi:hypothetical protein
MHIYSSGLSYTRLSAIGDIIKMNIVPFRPYAMHGHVIIVSTAVISKDNFVLTLKAITCLSASAYGLLDRIPFWSEV